MTTSAVEFMAPNTLAVTVQNTRVRDSNAFQFAEAVVVPVQDIFERLRGAGATRVTAEVTYLDDSLRVTMTKPDNQLFIYRRA